VKTNFLKLTNAAILSISLFVSGVAVVASAPPMMLCSFNQEIVSGEFLRTEPASLSTNAATFDCVEHNMVALYGFTENTVNYALNYLGEIALYSLILILPAFSFLILMNTFGLLNSR
jgi:hypothetical protein